MNAPHPLALLGATFASGALAGLVFLWGSAWLSPDAASALLDLHRDGLDWKDAGAFAWLFGHVAILVHHVLPGIASN